MSRIALVYDEGVIPEIVTDDPNLRVFFVDNMAPDGLAFETETVVRRVSREAFNMLLGKPAPQQVARALLNRKPNGKPDLRTV